MGHEGMRASLVSREVIADSVELVMHAERFDGMVTIAGCDKSLPGMLMASARINRPAIFYMVEVAFRESTKEKIYLLWMFLRELVHLKRG